MNMHWWRLRISALLAVVGVALALSAEASASVGVPTDFGLSAAWWNWAVSQPASNSPLTDETGSKCAVAQSGRVFFLAGTLGGSATRTCTVPEGDAILVPIINAECSTAEGNGTTAAQLSACAKDLMDHVTSTEASLDGIELARFASYRVQSGLFALNVAPGNVFGIPAGRTNSVADGFWVLLPPLRPGAHTIHFHGVAPFPEFGFTFEIDVTYHLTVR